VRSAALATDRVERRLPAILTADVAGYSCLVGADEEGTLARLKAHRRELIDPKIQLLTQSRHHSARRICSMKNSSAPVSTSPSRNSQMSTGSSAASLPMHGGKFLALRLGAE